MSILIKGMEMPKDCKNCPLLCNYFCRALMLEPDWGLSGRDGRCPLVPVPPHGDLIERETVHELVNWTRFKPPFSRKQVRRFIDNAPTIIEAEVDNG